MIKLWFILFVVYCIGLQAEDNTTKKLGIGISFISLPEYIGSSVQKNLFFPYPYIYYDSDNLTIEKNKVFGHLYSNDFNIDLSLSGTMPVKNDDNSLRYEMKQLDPTLETGIKFIYKMVYFKNTNSYISIELPIRTVWSVDISNTNNIGYITDPNLHINYYFTNLLQLQLTFGPVFATKKYYNYFYEVTSKDTTPTREKYSSQSGYGGWRNTIGIAYEEKSFWYGAFIKYYNLKDSKFENSPLVDKSSAVFYGLAISYIF